MSLIDKAVSAATEQATNFLFGDGGDLTKRAFPAPNKNVMWQVSGKDWYKTFGYQFILFSNSAGGGGVLGRAKDKLQEYRRKVENQGRATARALLGVKPGELGGILDDITGMEAAFYFTLPIPPQSISIKPILAGKATATLSGVVEENSPTTFWMIQMSGTTGIAPGRGFFDLTAKKEMASGFRNVIGTTGLLSTALSGLNRAIGRYVKPIEQGADALSAALSLDPAGAAQGVIGAINDQIVPPLPYNGSAVPYKSNGFKEIQELSRFIHSYQKLKGDSPKSYQMKFAINKTNQVWDVVIKNFEIQQSAQNPHLYRYNIVLQGYNVMDVSMINGGDRNQIDRFGPSGDLKAANTLSYDKAGPAIKNIGKGLGFG